MSMFGYVGALLYVLIVCLFWLLAKGKYAGYRHSLNGGMARVDPKRKFGIGYCLFFSFCFVLLNYLVTTYSDGFGFDRRGYYLAFLGVRKTSYPGFDFLFSTLHSITSEFTVVLYFTTFVCCMMLFAAYRHSYDAAPTTLLFVFSTMSVFMTFSGLKQCYADAFAAIFFCMIGRPKSLKRDIVCLLCVLAACSFHAVAVILIPLLVWFWIRENNSKYTMFYTVLLVIGMLFIQQWALVLGELTREVHPILSYKLLGAFGEAYRSEGINITFLKGLPYYALALWGTAKRKQALKRYKNYDKYYFVTCLGALLYFVSIRSYWMTRYLTLFVFPMGILYTMLMQNARKNERYIMGTLVPVSSFAVILRYMIGTFVLLGAW